MPAIPEFWFDWSSLFTFSGILATVFAIGLAASQYRMLGRPLSLRWLILLLVCIGVIMAEQVLRNSSLIGHFPRFLFMGSPFLFLYLPLILFYNYAVLHKDIRHLFHLLLPIAMLAVMIPTYRIEGAQKLDMYFNQSTGDPIWIIGVYLLYCGYYLVRIFRANRLLRKALKDESASDKIEYFALANSIISKTSLLALIFPVSLLLQYLPLAPHAYYFGQKLLFTVFSASGHLLLFSLLLNKDSLSFGLNQVTETPGPAPSEPDLLPAAAALEPQPAEPWVSRPEKPAETLERPPVKLPEDLEAKKREIYAAMETGRYFMQPDLTLNFLATELGLSRTALSAIINQGFGQNFYDFVNTFRIQAAEEMLRQGAHQKFTMDHIAQASGFSNYTSFYRIFKRFRNQTPSDFLKSLKGQLFFFTQDSG